MAERPRGRRRGAWADYLGGAPAHPDPIPSGHLGVAGDRLVFVAPGGAQLAIPLPDLRGLSLSGRNAEGERRATRTVMRVAVQRDHATAVLEFAIERRQAAALRILIERSLARLGLEPLPLVEQLEPREEPQPSAGSRSFAAVGPLLVAAMPTLILVAFAAFLVLRSESNGGDGGAAGSSAKAATSSHSSKSSEASHAGWKPHPGPVPILMYHPIQDPIANAPEPELFVRTEDFRAQMNWLDEHGYEGVTLDQVESGWARGKALPPKPVVLTFDDGYQSQSVNALPVLEKLGWPAVIDLKSSGADLPDDKVKRMIDAGWELASHTIDHVDLTTVAGAELTREVAGSRRDLRRRFQVPVNNFCYPSGRYDPAVVQAVKAAGYRGATTTDPGLGRSDQLFTLKRIRISLSDRLSGFVKKLQSGGTYGATAGGPA